ncbi:MAG: CotH kinase family protein [Bacteroidaceae bacterium]|nr:CotH kinase family protein [Bacteroidaceae bacterium]
MKLRILFITSFLLFVFRGHAQQNIIINEIQVANIDMFVDPSFNYGGWIELYNPSDTDVNLTGWYVSDTPDNLKKHVLSSKVGTIKAKGYKVLWFDHYNKTYSPSQIDSKLDSDGGSIYLSNNKGVLVCSLNYPEAVSRTSFARTSDGSDMWGITYQPTPDKSNESSNFASEQLEPPMVNRDGGLFTTPFTFSVVIPTGATLRYTTDGTTPTETNGKKSTTGNFAVDATRVFRFRLFKDGYLPSRVVTRSYIYADREYNLPVVSVVTDPVNLYSDSLGIFVEGVNGRPGNGMDTPANWNMEWDRPVNFEYFTLDGKAVINQEANMEMCGGWSRMWTPHSFKIKANKVYEGENFIPYQVFPNKAYLKHKTLQLRNGGNDFNSRIKDAALQAIVLSSGLEIDGQECQSVVHFINGEYNGVLNIREPNNKHYVEANYALEEEDIDQFELSSEGFVFKCGTKESFNTWYELTNQASTTSVYKKIREIVDVDEFINYMAVQMYLGNSDWPGNNVKAFKPRYEGGKYRFILFDLDHSFGYTEDVFSAIENNTWVEFITIFKNMLRKNSTFRKQFIDTYCLVAGSVFIPERCNAIIDSMAYHLEKVLEYEGDSPWWTADEMKSRLSTRQETMINALKSYSLMELKYVTSQKVELSTNIPQAKLSVNGLPVPLNYFDGTLFAPITLKAEAPAGFRFEGWKYTKTSQEDLFKMNDTWYYYDQGSLDGKDWRSGVMDTWKSGDSPLGYYTGDSGNSRGYNTFLDYGGDDGNKRRTYYFSKEFMLDYTPSDKDIYTMTYKVDDGMIVYINGKEATRYLMPEGEVEYKTFATTHAPGNPDGGSLELPYHLFKQGKNVIAVEVHNNSSSSSDIFFDAEISVGRILTDANVISTEEKISLPKDESMSLQACYVPIDEDEMENVHSVPVRINEISADNSIYVNATYFKRNDWIELYNTTPKAIDVAGMYLTDKIDKPYKYQIPSSDSINTIIPPYGYLVLWADKLSPVKQLHTDFKLDNEGGLVMLTSADETWSDTLFYPPHNGYESVGLYPDGGMNSYVMNVPTISTTNQWSSYVQYINESDLPASLSSVEYNLSDYRIAWVDGSIMIWGTSESEVEMDIFHISGLHLGHSLISVHEGLSTKVPTNLSEGIYVVRIRDEKGYIYSQKLVVR